MNSVILALISVVYQPALAAWHPLLLISEKSIQKTLLYFVSFSTGGLLGDVFIHIIPEISENTSFFFDRTHHHSCWHPLLVSCRKKSFTGATVTCPKDCDHAENTAHHHHHHSVGLMSIMGESVHKFIDGVIIASSYMVSIPLGISTTLAIVFHEIPHEVGNFAVLLHSGFSRKKALMFNTVGKRFDYRRHCSPYLQPVIRLAQRISLPFAAGNLLYIAGSDLIPELHKETGIRQGIIQLLAMIGGMLVMYAILLFE